jgi:hypothetical protein
MASHRQVKLGAVLAAGVLLANLIMVTGVPEPAQAAASSSWAVSAVASPAFTNAILDGISCPSATWCLSVGSGHRRGAHQPVRPLAEEKQGAVWRVVSPRNWADAVFSAVDCAVPDECIAVGASTGATNHTLAASWDGRRWARMSTPNNSVGTGTYLHPAGDSFASVSCVSASTCIAVGNTYIGGHQEPLAEELSGGSWQLLPDSNGDDGTEEGVSCTGGHMCVIVGALPPHNASAAVWDTKTMLVVGAGGLLTSGSGPEAWGIAPSMTSASDNAALGSVSCTSTTSCLAVGNYGTGPQQLPFSEAWSGGNFWDQANPLVPLKVSALSGVSCTRAFRCFAVGHTTTTGAPRIRALVEIYGAGARGSWALLPSATPAVLSSLGPLGTELIAVSCTPGTPTCTAVGARLSSGGGSNSQPFAVTVSGA